jgi:hypothetical protein
MNLLFYSFKAQPFEEDSFEGLLKKLDEGSFQLKSWFLERYPWSTSLCDKALCLGCVVQIHIARLPSQ